MTFSGCNLYVKTGLWLLLNLVLLTVLAGCLAVYGIMGHGYDGVLPAALFSPRADSILRMVSSNIQYRQALEWQGVTARYADRLPVRLHIQTLDTETIKDPDIPVRMVEQARALPRSTYTFCPEPETLFWDPLEGSLFAQSDSNIEYGLPPVPPALFRYTSNPSRYWLGRVLYVPDHNRQVHTLLLVMESDSPSGHGLFFDFRILIFLVMGALGISFLWWLPFMCHLSRPLRRMAQFAGSVEADSLSAADSILLQRPEFSGRRCDEIGRLGHALVVMAQRMNRLVTGQSQFIRHVAHELNTPLAKAQMGLAVLECKLEGDERTRVQQVLRHINRLSVLTEEVLSYLQAKASLAVPKPVRVELCDFFSSLIQSEAAGCDVQMQVPAGLVLYVDRDYLRRSVINLLRNALRYAGEDGPVIISAEQRGEDCIVRVSDSGPGVPEKDLPTLCEPFFRGTAAASSPGGTGLGLTIVKSCVEQIGGRMEYGNRGEKGFEVRLFFPMKKG